MNPADFDRVEILLIGIIVTLIGNALVTLFRSPKEMIAGVERKLEALSQKLDLLDGEHSNLEIVFARHDTAMQNLTKSVDRLADRLDKLEPLIRKPRNG